MYYNQRRVHRHRMMRRAAFINNIRNAATFAMDFIPDLFAGFGIAITVFYLIPILIGMLAAAVR